MKSNILMIQTKDQRRFWTARQNLLPLTEFAKTFDLEFFLVKAEETPLLTLEELATAFCEAQPKPVNLTYTVIRQLYPRPASPLRQIRTFVRTQLLQKKSVSLTKIKSQFKTLGLSSTIISRYFSSIRNQMVKQGYVFERTALSTYRLILEE